MKFAKILFISALFAIIGLASCKKNDKEILSISDYQTMLQDEAQVSDMMDDIDNEADDVMSTGLTIGKSASINDTTNLEGRKVEWSSNTIDAIKIVITFTNFSNPKFQKERIKNGKIIIVLKGGINLRVYKREITFENFSINGNKIEGIKTIEKLEGLKYRITLKNGKITFTDGKIMTHNYTRNRTMLKGSETPLYIWDDEFSFEGDASGVNKKGIAYNKLITKPIIILTRYKFPVSGTFNLTVNGLTMSLDYGDGTLDTKATVSINGANYDISFGN